MQTLGSWLQLVGTLIAGAGFLYAWNRLMCWVQSSPDWRAGHGDAPGRPDHERVSTSAVRLRYGYGRPPVTLRVREGVS